MGKVDGTKSYRTVNPAGALLAFSFALLAGAGTLRAAEPKPVPQPLVEYPYVSIYYTRPTVSPGEIVPVKFYVTDWHHSLVRKQDASRRFDVMLEYGPVGKPRKTITRKNIPSGDHELEIGPFERGDYVWAIWVKDCRNGLESHRVVHDVRVRTPEELVPTEKETYRATDEDVRKYGLLTEREGRYRTVLVDTPDDKTKLCATNVPANVAIPEDGYVVFVPAEKGKRRFRTFLTSHIVYGPKWDPAAVAVAATNNNIGLQKLLDDVKAAGYRKLVLPNRRFRIAPAPALMMPNGFTLDLGGATLKLNGFAGCGCFMVKMTNVWDSHLVNGTLEGEYYEHDYANSAHSSEWVDAICIDGDSRYCTVENMLVTHITGYGSIVNMGNPLIRPGCKTAVGLDKCEPGAVDSATGKLDASVAGRYTGDWTDLVCFSNVDRFCVSHRIDPIRGRSSRSWLVTVSFYDGAKNFLSQQVAFQYRDVLIPAGARFARVTVECDTLKDARNCSCLTFQTYCIPEYCAFRNNRFYLNRSTAHVPFVCREILTERNDIGYCGEAVTHCGVDFEDGEEGLQDFYLRDNVFHDTQNSDVIANTGLNCVLENNVATISARPKLNSPCIRNNVCPYANFLCGYKKRKSTEVIGHEATMYGRYYGNVFKGPLTFGESRCDDGWTIALSGTSVAGTPEKPVRIVQGASGDIRNCAFTNCVFWSDVHFVDCTFANCTFTYPGFKGHWKNCTFDGAMFLGSTSNVFMDCTLRDATFHNLERAFVGFVKCRLENTASDFRYWAAPAKILMHSCDVKGTNNLWNVGLYNIGRFDFRKCTFDLGDRAVVNVCDLRGCKTDGDCEAVVSAEDCVMKSMLYECGKGEREASKRPVVFGWANCRRAKNLPLGRRVYKGEEWRDLEEKDFLDFKKTLKKVKR